MLVSSTLCPSDRTSVHLFVVHYDEDRVLVPVNSYVKYADLQDYVAKEWNLEKESIALETDELDICAGIKIRIHEETWIWIKDLVGNVYVRVRYPSHANARPERQQVALASNVKYEPKREGLEMNGASSESADEAEVEQQTSTGTLESEHVGGTPLDGNHGQDVEVNGHEHEQPDAPTQGPGEPKPVGEGFEIQLNVFNNEADAGEEPKETLREKEQTSKPTAEEKPSSGRLLDSGRAAPENPPNSATTSTTGSTLCTFSICPAREGENNSQPRYEPISERLGPHEQGVIINVEPPPNSYYRTRRYRFYRERKVVSVLKYTCKAFSIDYMKYAKHFYLLKDVLTSLKFHRAQLLQDLGIDSDGERVLFNCHDFQTMGDLEVGDELHLVIRMVN
ncbi:uncharacterized protein FOMMEDRAFT_25337 [Fomitiporia mediterranea MF3/22]|uniref:uncharacterized protein n=1 Tax=Fomitiporia mediterranea (strain MF3/22) TaxID=694068 RepID=UPI0004407C94|nr:uncharacterized protein FOMMEDRAFT_25337 [Fomitiporia mediterranea MF3/22]EJD08177.1 hypothetical protein FOMMEDRAFT_25337 [Fomitiporia mediterranea MF3/22]